MFSFLIGIIIGVVLGAVVVGICECVRLARRVFESTPSTTKVRVIKTDSPTFRRVLGRCERLRRALEGDQTATAVAFTYKNGKIDG